MIRATQSEVWKDVCHAADLQMRLHRVGLRSGKCLSFLWSGSCCARGDRVTKTVSALMGPWSRQKGVISQKRMCIVLYGHRFSLALVIDGTTNKHTLTSVTSTQLPHLWVLWSWPSRVFCLLAVPIQTLAPSMVRSPGELLKNRGLCITQLQGRATYPTKHFFFKLSHYWIKHGFTKSAF